MLKGVAGRPQGSVQSHSLDRDSFTAQRGMAEIKEGINRMQGGSSSTEPVPLGSTTVAPATIDDKSTYHAGDYGREKQ